MRAPELSAVVTLQGPPAAGALEALLEEGSLPGEALEVILVGGGDSGWAARAARRHPGTVPLEPPGSPALPALQQAGITRARGRLVALLDGDCRPGPGWVAAAVAAHRGGDGAAVGGAVEPGDGLQPVDQALFYCDYAPFLLPFPAGPAADLPGNNVVFRAEVLRPEEAFADGGFWKTFFCRRLQARGERLLADPRLVVYYHRSLGWRRALRRRYVHGRCFGAMRARRSTAPRRAAYGLAGPALPAVLTARLVRRVRGKGRHQGRLLRLLPLCLLLHAVWCGGEWLGNLAGDGGACRRL